MCIENATPGHVTTKKKNTTAAKAEKRRMQDFHSSSTFNYTAPYTGSVVTAYGSHKVLIFRGMLCLEVSNNTECFSHQCR